MLNVYVITLGGQRQRDVIEHLAMFDIEPELVAGVSPDDIEGTVSPYFVSFFGEDDSPRREAIRQAHLQALEVLEPCALLMQDDVRFTESPLSVPHNDGVVTVLAGMKTQAHVCPQALIIPSVQIKDQIKRAWRTRDRSMCLAWHGVEKHHVPIGAAT